jgi:hypothetical protein
MIYTMPRSHQLSHNQWRILVAVLAITLLLCTGFQADAQQRRRRKPANAQQTNTNSNTATTADASQPKKKSLAPLRTGETPEGGRATITSDAPLNDYEAYRSGNRYYVVIPGASAPNVPSNVRGRGFDDVQVHKRGNDTVLSFRLKPGTSAHVNQKFNKLDVVFNSPADAASGAQSGTTTTANTPAGTTAPNGTGNANSQRPNPETATATPKPPNVTTATGPTATVTPGSTPATVASATPPALTTEPGGATTTAALPTVTPALGSVTETPATASPTPPTDQVAQAQPAPSVPVAVTTTPATSGSSLGAVLRSNWLIILIAALLLISIGLVAMTRSRRKGVEEPRRISDEGTPALEDAKETASAMRLDAAPAAGAAAAVVAAAPVETEAQAVARTDETEQETVEAEPPDTYNVERVRLEIKHVLTGESYDEAIINAPFSETRQLIESELLFALSRRNTERRHRALKAFTEHGYFDDATRDLRTAAVPAERAAAARKLGLTRDSASTPHLVAALEDSAPEVRRAAVEALTELQDQSAVAPLESLLKREEDRKVPHALIQRAIRANSTGAAEQEEKPAAKTAEPLATAEVASEVATSVEAAPIEAAPVETELVESAPVETTPIEAAPVNAEEVAVPVEETADMSLAAGPLASSLVEESSVSAPEASLAVEEEPPTLEAEPVRTEDAEAAPSEQTSELTAASLLAPAIVAGLATAEAKASERRRAEADAARIHAEQEAERQAAEEERQRAEEEEALRRVEEAARLRAEAETQRVAEETRRREEEQERRRIEEERLRAEEEQRRAEDEQRRVEAERLAAEERRRAEEQQRLEEERLRVEAEQRRAEEERLRAEEEQRRAEDERRRVEAEAARQREEEAAQQRAEEEKRRAEEEEHRRVALERERQEEEERLRLVEEERQRSEEARRQRAEEREKRRAEEERSRLEAEERERSEADAARRRAEEAALRLAEMRRRMEEEARLREEAEAERLRVEEEARVRAEEEAARQLAEEEEAEAARQQEEEEERQRLEAAAARQREEEAAALRLEEEERRIAEERRRAEEESRRYAEEERRRVEEESRQRAEAEAARIEFEREAAERRLRAEAEAVRIEPEEIEPAYTEIPVETPQTVAQSDLFEASFAEHATSVQAEEISTEATASPAPDWVDVDINETETVYDEQPVVSASPVLDEETVTAEAEPVPVTAIEESVADTSTREIEVAVTERGIAPADDDDFATVPSRILQRLGSEVASEREAAVSDLARVGGEDAFREISAAFDDPVQIVRDAAARALFNLNDDHAASFTRALREAPPDRRRRIGSALASSGLANQAIGHLMGESREKTYDAFSLLFLMSKAGEVQPLMRAIEEHPSSEVRLAVVKLLALSGQQDILPAFRRLAVRGSLPTEVRSAVMEAIYQISSQTSADTTHVA